MDNIAIAEFAGRDSMVAILMELNNFDKILPVACKIPVEQNNDEYIIHNFRTFLEEAKKNSFDTDKIMPIEIVDGTKVWTKNVKEDIEQVIKNCRFYSPCIKCHLALHLSRVNIAKKYSCKIITGERLLHDERVKLNQRSIVIQKYKYILKNIGVELITPVINIESDKELDGLIKKEYIIDSMCPFSGNYNNSIDDEMLKKYVELYVK